MPLSSMPLHRHFGTFVRGTRRVLRAASTHVGYGGVRYAPLLVRARSSGPPLART